MTTTPVALGTVPEAAPAWWLHWLNLAIAAATFVGVGIHPGWHPPELLAEIVAPLAIVLAVASGLVFAVLHHKTSTTNRTAAIEYLRTTGASVVQAATMLAPLIDKYPAVETRLAALEASQTLPELPPDVQRLVDALRAPATTDHPTPTVLAAPGAAEPVS